MRFLVTLLSVYLAGCATTWTAIVDGSTRVSDRRVYVNPRFDVSEPDSGRVTIQGEISNEDSEDVTVAGCVVLNDVIYQVQFAGWREPVSEEDPREVVLLAGTPSTVWFEVPDLIDGRPPEQVGAKAKRSDDRIGKPVFVENQTAAENLMLYLGVGEDTTTTCPGGGFTQLPIDVVKSRDSLYLLGGVVTIALIAAALGG